MTYHPDDPNLRRREAAAHEGTTTGTIMGIVVAAVVVIGALFYAFSDRDDSSASNTPGTERSAPATTGQGSGNAK